METVKCIIKMFRVHFDIYRGIMFHVYFYSQLQGV